jgi:prevent-host-death family protein
MDSVTAFEAKTRFGKLLERVSRGEEIIITRHDRAVARIIPEGGRNLKDVRAAVAGLRKLRGNIAKRFDAKPRLSQRDIKSLIDEGR